MKAFLAGAMFVLGLAALPAAADPERSRAFGFRPEFRVQQTPPGQFKGDKGRDFRRDRQVNRGERPQGRLTDEERRELRRDLDKANRELYRRRPER